MKRFALKSYYYRVAILFGVILSFNYLVPASAVAAEKPKPDLIMLQVEPNASTVNAGAILSVADTVKNQGPADAKKFKVGYHLSGDAIYGNKDDTKIPGSSSQRVGLDLAAGASSASGGFSIEIPEKTPPGTYHVCASVSSTPGESDKSNDTLCSTGTVTVPPPDLVISALSTATTTAKIGSVIKVSLSVTNQGGSQSNASKVELHASTNTTYGDGDDLSSANRPGIPKLQPGQSKTFANQPVKVPSTPGTYFICAKSDPDGVVTEGNETNNTLCTATQITVFDPATATTTTTSPTTTTTTNSTTTTRPTTTTSTTISTTTTTRPTTTTTTTTSTSTTSTTPSSTTTTRPTTTTTTTITTTTRPTTTTTTTASTTTTTTTSTTTSSTTTTRPTTTTTTSTTTTTTLPVINPVILTMTANPDPIAPLALVTYELKVSNVGNSTLTNVVLQDTSPNNGFGIGSTITRGGSCPGGNNCVAGAIISWPAFTLTPGQTQTFTFAFQPSAGTQIGTLIHNSATVTYLGGTSSDQRDVVVNGTTGLGVELVEDHDPVKPGDQLIYTVRVGNTAIQALPLSTLGVLAAKVPVGTTFVSASGGGTLSGDTVQWNIGSVTAGGSQSYTFTVTVGALLSDGTVLKSQAQVLDGAVSLTRALAATEVKAGSPLTLSMTATPDPVAPLALVTYELKVSNVGNSTLTNLALQDLSPNNGFSLGATITGGGSCPGGNNCATGAIISWPVFTLTPGQTQTFTFAFQPSAGTPNGTLIHNSASVTYVTGTISQWHDVAVKATAGLEVGLEEDHDPVKPGDQIIYTVRVGNTAIQALPLSTLGVLAAKVPVGTTFVSASGGGTLSGDTVQWNIGSVAAGGSQSYTYKVTVDGLISDGAVLKSQAEVLDGTLSLTQALAATEVKAGSPLTLSMTATPDPVAPLALVTYELKVSNVGNSTLTNLALQDLSPNNGFSLGATITGGGSCPGGNNCATGAIISWPVFTLTPGQTQTFTFAFQPSAGTLNGTLIHNDATVTYTGGTISQGSNLAINATAGLRVGLEEDHDPVKPGDQIIYTVRVGNTAIQALPLSTLGVLAAKVPVGTTFVSASGGGTLSGDTVQWNIGSVAAGGSQSYTYKVTVDGLISDGAVLKSQAEVLDGTLSLTQALAATEVKAGSPLTLSMTATPDPVAPLALVTYELKVSNVGNSTLTNLALQDLSPNNGFSLGATITGGGSCPGGNNCATGAIISWPVFTLTPGQTQTFTFAFQPSAGTLNGTLIHNDATVTYTGGTISQGSNLAINATAGLRVGLEEDHDPVKPGDQIIYTVRVGNTAIQALPLSTLGVLAAKVPVGTTFVSASGGGTLSGDTVQWNIGSVTAGGNQSYTYTVTVGALTDATVLKSQAQVLDGAVSLTQALAATEVKAGSPLTLSMTATPDPVAPLALVTYELKVSNVGNSTLTNLALQDLSPNNGFSLGATITGGGSCPGGNNCATGAIISWPVFTLTPGQTQTFTFAFQPSAGTLNGTLIHNDATVTYTGGTISQGSNLAIHN